MHSTPHNFQRAQNKRDVVKLAKERNVRFVRLVFADIFGVSKNVSIPATELEAALEGRVTFDGGSIDGFVRGEELDMVLRPDPATFALYPWSREDAGEARLICDIAMPDGSPFEGCPRTTLQRAVEGVQTRLPDLRIGLETEFYLFERRETVFGSTETSDVGSYFDFSANDMGEDARNAIVAALQSMGIRVASAHHEHGAGQHEIDLAYEDPLAAADNVLTLRTIAKHIAAQFGLEATFMPKPSEDERRQRTSRRVLAWRRRRRRDDALRRRRIARACARNHRHLQSDRKFVQAPRRRVGRADLHRMVGTQRKRPRARSACGTSAPYRNAQPRSRVQSVSRARGAHRLGARRRRPRNAARDMRSPVRRTI